MDYWSHWESAHQDHEAGWSVLLDGEEIALLSYVRHDWPWRVFRAHLKTQDEEKISYALRFTAKRPPGDRVVFRSLASGALMPDAEVFVAMHEDGTVGLRDMRFAVNPPDEKAVANKAVDPTSGNAPRNLGGSVAN